MDLVNNFGIRYPSKHKNSIYFKQKQMIFDNRNHLSIKLPCVKYYFDFAVFVLLMFTLIRT